MKRMSLAAAALILAAGALLALAGGRGEPNPPTIAPAESTPRWVPAVRVAAPDPLIGPAVANPDNESPPPTAEMQSPRQAASSATGLVRELITILNETKSVDTFIVTCGLLEKMGTEARPAIPAMLRNAERLGLLKKSLLTGKEGRRQLSINSLAEMIEHIVAPKGDGCAEHDRSRACAEPAQHPPCHGAQPCAPYTCPAATVPPMPAASGPPDGYSKQ
jgi:hypothetical protein